MLITCAGGRGLTCLQSRAALGQAPRGSPWNFSTDLMQCSFFPLVLSLSTHSRLGQEPWSLEHLPSAQGAEHGSEVPMRSPCNVFGQQLMRTFGAEMKFAVDARISDFLLAFTEWNRQVVAGRYLNIDQRVCRYFCDSNQTARLTVDLMKRLFRFSLESQDGHSKRWWLDTEKTRENRARSSARCFGSQGSGGPRGLNTEISMRLEHRDFQWYFARLLSASGRQDQDSIMW